ATVRNNIIFAPNGTAPLDRSSFAASNNLCGSGSSCGSSGRTWSNSAVLSTDPDSPDFMRPANGSPALDGGTSISGLSSSYNGITRPLGSAYDIGAFEGASAGSPAPPPPVAPEPPTDLTVS